MNQISWHDERFESTIAQIDSLLVLYKNSFPIRGEQSAPFLHAVRQLIDFLAESIDLEAFQPSQEALETARELARRPIFICGQMKSGTTLMLQLLDDHPELMVIPIETHHLKSSFIAEGENFRELAAHWVWRLIRVTGPESFWFLRKNRRDLESFVSHLHFFMKRAPHDNLTAMMLALHFAQDRPAPARQWVEKTPQSELYVNEALKRFPDAKFLHIVRNPLQNLASLKRNQLSCQKVFRTKRRARKLRELLRTGRLNQQNLGPDRYRFVRYEDVVHSPEATMHDVADFLGIKFNRCLLTPTLNGKPAQSNSMYKSSRVKGRILDQSATERYLEDFRLDDIRSIVDILGQEASLFGYDWKDIPANSPRFPPIRLLRYILGSNNRT